MVLIELVCVSFVWFAYGFTLGRCGFVDFMGWILILGMGGFAGFAGFAVFMCCLGVMIICLDLIVWFGWV